MLLSVVTQSTLTTVLAQQHNVDSVPTFSSAKAPTPSPTPSPGPSPAPHLSSPETDEVRALLGACDRALSDCSTLIETKNAKIQKQQEIILVQDDRITALEKDRDSLFKNPILWTAVGVIIGGVAIGISKR